MVPSSQFVSQVHFDTKTKHHLVQMGHAGQSAFKLHWLCLLSKVFDRDVSKRRTKSEISSFSFIINYGCYFKLPSYRSSPSDMSSSSEQMLSTFTSISVTVGGEEATLKWVFETNTGLMPVQTSLDILQSR